MGKLVQLNGHHLWRRAIARWWMIVRGVMLGMPGASLSWAIAGGASGELVPLKPVASAQQHLSQSDPSQSKPSQPNPSGLPNLPTDDVQAQRLSAEGLSIDGLLTNDLSVNGTTPNLAERNADASGAPSRESCAPRRTKAELDRLLEIRNTTPTNAAEIDRQIHHLFGETHAVMVLDMSGFSLRTLKLGIIPTLAVIKRLQTAIVPIITGHQGTIVKLEADNVFAVFPEVRDAVAGAIAIHQYLLDTDLRVSIGIGYGEMLMIAEEDMFGTELNLASKLGEDLAEPGETMITEMAFQRLSSHGLAAQSTLATRNWKQSEIVISGVRMLAYSLKTAAGQPK